MKLLVLAVVLAVTLGTSNGRRISKCELARTLFNNGIPRSQIPDWICLVERESQFETTAINKKNTNGSWDYGLFQVNNKFWCADQRNGANDCKIQCSALVDGDITDDIKCIKLIYKRHNFNAWTGWKNYCKGKKLPSVAECF
uniref:Glycosyl hydrolases family 22 (GH22) domain-containing protein n=1 Tax=Anopheles farauti TaxID=69004 RepID=A0A182QTU6_9DIPT